MSIKDRLGKCYELSWQYVTRNRSWNLVHGFITDRRTGRVIDHAWAEKGNQVYDPVLDKKMDKKTHELLFHAEVSVVYTSREAMEKAGEIGTYGPWHKIPRGKVRWWPIKDNF